MEEALAIEADHAAQRKAEAYRRRKESRLAADSPNEAQHDAPGRTRREFHQPTVKQLS